MLYIKVKVKSGIYRVRMPMGRTGAIHFAIITKYMDEGNTEVTLEDKAKMEAGEKVQKKLTATQKAALAEAFIEWSGKVLPQILVGFTKSGANEEVQIKVEDVSGEDQYAIFAALLEQLEVDDDEFFRVVE